MNETNKTVTNSKTVIETRNLSYRYSPRQKYVLNDITLSFEERKLTVIAGPNGSGKTTFMKHLNGTIIPQKGEIITFGQLLTKKNKKEVQKRIGLVFQNPDEQIFFPKVHDDIAFGPKNMGLSWEEIDERVAIALEEVEITHLKNKITFNLSFGEKKKVAFAGILAMDPSVFILDEPTAGIDPWSKPRMIRLIQSFTKKRTVIVITHDFDLMKIADRIILMKEGRIVNEYSSFDAFAKEEFSGAY